MSQALQELISVIHTELSPVKAELESHFLAATSNKDSLENVENDFRLANELFNELSQAFNAANIQFIQHENKLKSNQQTLLYKQNQLDENTTRSQQAEEEIAASRTEIETIKLKTGELDTLLIELYKEKETKMTVLSEQETGYYQLKEAINSIEDDIREKNRYKQGIDQSIQHKKELLNELKLKLNILKERLSIEFKIDANEFSENLELPQTPKDDLYERLEKVKRRIENFGEVNPMAEEAYNEMKDRFEFITAQKKDDLRDREYGEGAIYGNVSRRAR
jgi:chromosome segregation protein